MSHVLVLTEEQESIRKMAHDFVQERMPITHLRGLRDRADKDGLSRAIWKEMAALGVAGMIFPESAGGAGLGLAELGIVLEECGRTLAPTPILSTVVLAGSSVALGGRDALKAALLPQICAGEKLLALAHEEGTRHARYRIATEAVRAPGGYRITGDKTFVLDGHVAGAFVVVARLSGNRDARDGLLLALVPADARGVAVTRTSMVDSRNAARVRFEEVEVRDEDVLGVAGEGADLLDRALDRGALAISAEMLGGALEAFDQTIAYLKTRKQFGVPIGSFQALKHRAAHMFCELELTKSIVLEGLRSEDERGESGEASLLAAAAKARATETFLLAANEAIQMHGGIGVTDELDVGLFLKRARVAEITLGDAAYQRDRYARLLGY
jgi:alkylation response protein AidB-like acyl-CoA dehydrogenase